MFFHIVHYIFLFLAFAVYCTAGGAVSGILRRRGASEETYLSSGIFWPVALPLLSCLWLANRTHVVVMTFPEHTTYQNRMLETKLDQQERIAEKLSVAAENVRGLDAAFVSTLLAKDGKEL